jgi:hypothetical protein
VEEARPGRGRGRWRVPARERWSAKDAPSYSPAGPRRTGQKQPVVAAYVVGEEHGALLIATLYEGGLDARRQGALGFACGGRLEHGTGRRWRGWGWPSSSEDGVVGGAGAGLR